MKHLPCLFSGNRRMTVVGRRVRRTTRRTIEADANDYTAAPVQEVRKETSNENYQAALNAGIIIL